MERNDAITGTASVRKAFALLDVLATTSSGMTAGEVATVMDLPLPTVYRLLKTLVNSEHLVHLKDESRYGLGYELHALGLSLRRQVGTPAAVARLILELHVRVNAAACYAVHRGDDAAMTSLSHTLWNRPPTRGLPPWVSVSAMLLMLRPSVKYFPLA